MRNQLSKAELLKLARLRNVYSDFFAGYVPESIDECRLIDPATGKDYTSDVETFETFDDTEPLCTC